MSAPPGRRGRVIGLVVATLLVLGAGAALTVVLLPSEPSPVLGDPRTVDPCGLLDEASLATFGAVRVDPDLGPLASCTATVDGAGAAHTVTVSLLAPDEFPPPAPERSVGDVRISVPVTYPRGCGRYATLVDGTAVLFRTTTTRGTGSCAVADAVTASGVERLTAGTVARRSPDVAPVLARTDACTLVRPADVASVPGLDTGRVRAGFAGAGCVLGIDDLTAPYVSVEMVRQEEEPASTLLGRHEAVVTPVPGGAGEPGFCEVSLAQRDYPAAAGPRVEAVRLVFSGTPAQDGAALCTTATRLADLAEARLPDPE